MNGEKYKADIAVGHVHRQEQETPKDIKQLVNAFRSLASIAGYDIPEHIVFKDRVTGKEWR